MQIMDSNEEYQNKNNYYIRLICFLKYPERNSLRAKIKTQTQNSNTHLSDGICFQLLSKIRA